MASLFDDLIEQRTELILDEQAKDDIALKLKEIYDID
jgi:hypothetical protein